MCSSDLRPWAGRFFLSDTVGGHRVDLLWQGDDERDVPQRVTLHEIGYVSDREDAAAEERDRVEV